MCHPTILSLKCSLLLLALLMGLSAYAVTTETQFKTSTSIYKNTDSRKNTNFKTTIALDVKALSYVEASNVDSNFQQQVQIALNLKKEGLLFSETSLILGTFSEPNSFYYAFPQVYAGYGTAAQSIVIGRKTENLSFADTFFNFGLIQPHSTEDNINFISGGLTGVFGQLSGGGLGIIGGFMPIFIPSQGPQIKIDDGRVITSNRWAPQPPSKFKFGSEYNNINYAIRDYEITDIISNSGFMLNIYAGKNKIRPVFLATYAKKPINEVAMSRDTFSDIANFEGYVLLTPQVLVHEVQAIDLNLDYENLKTSFSYLADQPQNQQAIDAETIQTLKPLSIYSFFAALDLTSNFGRKFEIYAAAAMVSGGEIKDLNSDQQESPIAVAATRAQFKKPVRLGLKNDLFFVSDRAVETDINMTYDQELKGSLLSVQIKYSPLKNMKLSLGADVIGVENELPESSQGNFLDQNKANDRFFAGVNYVF